MRASARFFLFGLFAILGCSASPDRGVRETDSDTAFAVSEGSREAYGIMSFLNGADATYAVLDGPVGLDSRAARNIAQHVKGAEWMGGKTKPVADPTADDNPIDSIAEL